VARRRDRLDPATLRPSGALLGANIALGAAIERLAVAATGHDPTTLDLLVRLDLAPGRQLRAVELCRQLQLSPSHVSRMLDRAQAAGLVSRGPDPRDRRANLVSLTDGGRAVVATFAPRLHAVLDRVVFQTLDEEEIDRLVESLDRIEAAARRLGTDDPLTDDP
jgi:DNA-binding MarR family transcriptional regulator